MTEEPIVATKDRRGSYDAISSAKPGEPLFPIQGGDPLGPPTVLYWADLCRKAGLKESDPKKVEHALRKASDAEHVAWTMMAYQRGEVQPEMRRATYTDTPSVVHVAQEGRQQREALIHGSGRLHNALSEAQEVADMLARLKVKPEQEVKVREAVALLKEAAFEIEPRRGNERS